MYSGLVLATVLSVIAKSDGVKQVLRLEGDVKVALLLENCRNDTEAVPYRLQSLVSSSIWTTERINFLGTLAPLKLGLSVYETCTGSDYFKTIFHLYESDDYLLGLVHEDRLDDKVLKFCEALDFRTRPTARFRGFLLKAGIQFLSTLGWVENVTVFAPDDDVMKEFYLHSKAEFICIQECVVYENNCILNINSTNPLVFIGNQQQIDHFVKSQDCCSGTDDIQILFIPLDGSFPTDLPPRSFVIMPPHSPPSKTYQHPDNILPSPVLFEAAKPLLSYASNIGKFLENNCNETQYKLNCLRNKFRKNFRPLLISPTGILEALKIEPLRENFVYHIYRVETDINITAVQSLPLSVVFSYGVFDGNLTLLDHNFDLGFNRSLANTTAKCMSFFSGGHLKYDLIPNGEFNFRTEAWVYAFLSLSLLGVLFCIVILTFLLICIFRRDILEGNPILTLSLLLAVMVLFCAVLPFSLEYDKFTSNALCMAKTLGITLGYAFVFSLLLSRCILLATSSKEIGFMSHIAGPVQAFLCLFIFGVQAALSLQLISKCLEVYRCRSFIYLMSYNVMLLLLLLCLCPLIYKCQRNYREGKYFTIAIVLTTCSWSVWVPLFGVLSEEWKEPMLCLGLVSTAAIFLGAVFIPRTYLMTIAAARDKITSTLPSLATGNSTLDIYRANVQPIYDCVNVAAINAVAVARAGVTAPTMQTIQQPDLYSCPALPDDDDFDFRCDTPPTTDKITRF
nr:protein bride of sevenless [Leptinotarsa decemlineata]